MIAMLSFIIRLPRRAKQAVILATDIALVPVALASALALQPDARDGLAALARNWESIPLLMMIAGLLAIVMGIHRVQLKAYETRAISMTGIHALLVGLSTAILDALANYGTPLATFINFALVYFLLTVTIRVVGLHALTSIYLRGRDRVRVLIYGAGRTGQQLAAALRTDDVILPVAFVDDNNSLTGSIVQGLRVYSPVSIADLVADKKVDRVLLAMPQVPQPKLSQISGRLADMGLVVQALPSFAQLAGNGAALVAQLSPVVPTRFLGRAPLDAELPGGSETYVGRSILVSGAGGSIGSELCRLLLTCAPRRIVLMEISELALYQIDMELSALAARTGVEIVPVLGSVSDGPLVRHVLQDNAVEIVLHAAAYKHVSIVEKNPLAGFANNVLGTHTLALAAAECGVRRFVLISSDKAVRPSNMMGASKRMAELVIQDLASRSSKTHGKTIFAMVRFGNVMGSSGSVVPLFQEQIAKGGPVTLTDRNVARFFMTIPEAARLVLVSGTFATGGEVFVLDMGAPVPIYDLARQMIEASGYRIRDDANPDGDIEIVLTGLRKGEKLIEELLIGEGQTTTPHPKILQAREEFLSEIEVAAALRALRTALADADVEALNTVVDRWVRVKPAPSLAAAERG